MSRRGQRLSLRDETRAAWVGGSRLWWWVEGCFLCNCLPRSRRDARLISFTRVLVVGQKLFLCRVGRGFAPLGLPVLIPRVKKRPSPRDPRGVVRETTPSNANKRRCRAGRVRLCPLPTFSGRFRCSGRVTAAEQHPSGRLRRCPAGRAYADEERGGFGANKFARNPTAFFLPAPSALNRPCFGFELRARADSPRFAAVCPPSRARRPAVALVVARCAPRVAAPSGDRCAVGGYSMPRQRP